MNVKTVVATAMAACGLVGTVFCGVQIADERYVNDSDFKSFAVEAFYEKFFANEDLMLEARRRGDVEAERKYQRNMERLKAKICGIDPNWTRCSE